MPEHCVCKTLHQREVADAWLPGNQRGERALLSPGAWVSGNPRVPGNAIHTVHGMISEHLEALTLSAIFDDETQEKLGAIVHPVACAGEN